MTDRLLACAALTLALASLACGCLDRRNGRELRREFESHRQETERNFERHLSLLAHHRQRLDALTP